jgi:hypothetical protein
VSFLPAFSCEKAIKDKRAKAPVNKILKGFILSDLSETVIFAEV